MRVLLVIPYFMPAISYGGPVRVAYDIAKALVAGGHQVTVATTDAFDDKRRLDVARETMDGIEVVRFRNLSNYAAKFFNAYTPLAFVPWLVRNLGTYDVVYCHDFFSLQSLCVGIASRLQRFPLVVQPHGSLSAIRRSARFRFLKSGLLKLFSGTLKNADAVIALTGQEQAEIVKVAPGIAPRVVIVPNGIVPDDFSGIEPADLSLRFGIPEGRRVIGFLGRLAHIKGLDVSLEVLARIKDRTDFSFLILGPDEGELLTLQAQVRRLGLGDRVVFGGTVDGRDKLSVMKACDLFLFTSRDEGLPMTVLEVAALGIPQVLSAECNVPEVAQCGAGYVHPLGDLEGLAGGVEAILTDPSLARTMGGHALRMVEERFDASQVFARVERVILEAARRAGP